MDDRRREREELFELRSCLPRFPEQARAELELPHLDVIVRREKRLGLQPTADRGQTFPRALGL